MRRAAIFALAVGASAAWAAGTLTAEDAVVAALARSPDVATADAALTTARAQLRQDGTFLENPEVDAQVSATTPSYSVEASQALSLTGEGWHARAADRANIEAAEHDRARTRLTVAHDVRVAWANAVLGAERATIAHEDLALATRLREAAEKRKAAGGASDLDLRLARLAEASAASAWLSGRREEDEALAELVALVGPVDGVSGDPLSAAPNPTQNAGTRSDVAAAEARVTAAEAALRQARAAALPAVRVGAYVERDGTEVSVGPSVGLELPLWSRNQAETGGAAAELGTARAEATQARVVADAEVTRARVLAGDADTVARLGSAELLDDARIALAEIERAYAAGALTLPDATEQRREVLDGQSAVLELVGQVVVARLDLLLATEDPALLPAGER